MLIYENLHALSQVQGDKICLIHRHLQLTYQDFSQQVEVLAYKMATQIKKGDKVLVKFASPVSQLLYFFGIVKAGGACVLVDPSTSDEVCAELVKKHSIDLYINEGFQVPMTVASVLPDIDQDTIFLGALSSGSTGTPKLIWRDHRSWTSAFSVQSRVFNLSTSDTLYLVGSLVYTANLNACLHLLSEGGTVVIASNTLPRTWLAQMQEYHVSAIFMVPTHYKLLLKVMKEPLLLIGSAVTAGAKIDVATVKSLIQSFPHAGIYEYYGASELGHVSYSTREDLLQHPETIGRAFPSVTISIEEGMIWVESPHLAPKYRPKATVEDLGKLGSDGYLHLLGRKHDLINTGGIKVIPREVEAILLECPGVAEVVVGGIDDPLRGQRVCAWVVKNSATLVAEDILDFCRKKIRHHYCPHTIVFIDEIPVNKNGKIDRGKLKSGGSHC